MECFILSCQKSFSFLSFVLVILRFAVLCSCSFNVHLQAFFHCLCHSILLNKVFVPIIFCLVGLFDAVPFVCVCVYSLKAIPGCLVTGRYSSPRLKLTFFQLNMKSISPVCLVIYWSFGVMSDHLSDPPSRS